MFSCNNYVCYLNNYYRTIYEQTKDIFIRQYMYRHKTKQKRVRYKESMKRVVPKFVLKWLYKYQFSFTYLLFDPKIK